MGNILIPKGLNIKRSLLMRFVILSVALLITVSFIGYFISTSQQKTVLLELAKKNAESTQNLITDALVQFSLKGILLNKFNEMDNYLKDSIGKGVEYVEVIENNKVIYSIGSKKEGKIVTSTKPLIFNEKQIGHVFVQFNYSYIDEAVEKSYLYVIIKEIISVILLIIGLSLLFMQEILKPIKKIVTSTNKLASGDLTVNYDDNNNYEIGLISHELSLVINYMRHVVDDIKSVSHNLIKNSEDLLLGTNTLKSNISEINLSTSEVLDGVKNSSKMFEETSSIVSSITKTSLEISNYSKEVNNVTTVVENAVATGSDSVNDVFQKINIVKNVIYSTSNSIMLLEEKSTEIDNIVTTIGNIATQTNLLALNAAIEAARAGDAGKGFAVVADEIRKLADSSTSNVHEISNTIQSIQKEILDVIQIIKHAEVAIDDGVTVTSCAKSNLDTIYKEVNGIVSWIKNISSMNIQQAKGLDEVSNSLDYVSSVAESNLQNIGNMTTRTQKVTAAIQKLDNMAEDLSSMAEELMSKIEIFKINK